VNDTTAFSIFTLEARAGIRVGGGRSDCDGITEERAQIAAIPFESFVSGIFSFRELGKAGGGDGLEAREECLCFCEKGVGC